MALEQIKGLSFPLRFGASGHFVRASGEEKLVGNLKALILTAINERPMEPETGTIGMSRLFRPSGGNPAARAIEHLVRDALNRFEPRVQVLAVQSFVERVDSGNALFVVVKYKIKNSLLSGEFTLRVGGDG